MFESISGLFNLRASDVRNTPVFYSYGLYSKEKGLHIFLHTGRVSTEVSDHFKREGVEGVKVLSYVDVAKGLKDFVAETTGKIIVPNSASYLINTAIPENRKLRLFSPVALLKTQKNAVESEGLRLCHLRDGAAIIRYLHWLEKNINSQEITELSGAAQLLKFRSEQDKFKGTSFTSISSVGANAASPHYSPTPETDTKLTKNQVYLIDSGGQYLDGTTDTTRTIHLGFPIDFERETFTRVLKGFIAIHTAVFPSGASVSFI